MLPISAMTFKEHRIRVLTVLSVIALASGLFFRGYDSPLGQSLSGLLNSTALLALIWTMPAPGGWALLRPVSWFCAALLWVLGVALVRAVLPSGTETIPLAPDLFLPRFVGLASGVCALVIGLLLGSRGDTRRLACDALLLLIAVHLMLGFIAYALPGDLWEGAGLSWDGRFAGLLGNSNVTGAISLAGGLVALSRWMTLRASQLENVRHDRGGLDFFYAGTLMLCLLGLVVPASRFPLAMGFLTFAILLGWRIAKEGRLGVISPRFLWIGGAVVLGVPILFSGFLLDRFASLGLDGYARGHIWLRFSEMAFTMIWTGYGPGAFSTAHHYYFRDALGFLQELLINSPHSILLQLLITGGLPYLLTMLTGSGLIGWRIVGKMRQEPYDIAFIGLVLAVIAVLGCAMVDIVLDVPAGVSIMALLAGLAWGRTCETERPPAVRA